MNQSKISVRYAKALLISAKEKNSLADVYNDVASMMDLLQNTAELNEVFVNPTIKPSLKISIMSEITKGMNDLLGSFVTLVISNNRENRFIDIFRDFMTFYKSEIGIKTANLTTVNKISTNNLEKIRTLLADSFNSKIEISQKTDEKIIGGFIIRIDDMQLDASISSELDKLKRELTSETFNSKL